MALSPEVQQAIRDAINRAEQTGGNPTVEFERIARSRRLAYDQQEVFTAIQGQTGSSLPPGTGDPLASRFGLPSGTGDPLESRFGPSDGTSLRPGSSAPSAGGGGVPGAPGATPEDVVAYIEENYPQFSWLIANPEMRQLFQDAMTDQYPPEKFQLELEKTEWWQNRSISMRNWEAKLATDSGEAERIFQQQRGLMADQALRMGADLDPGTLAKLADHALRFGWDENEINDALANHVSFADPTGAAAGAIQFANTLENDYAIPVTDGEKQEWAKRILTGEATQGSLRAEAVERAKSLWDPDGTTLAAGLDAGRTVRQLADGYIQLAARELEINPDEIDLSDPKWSRPLKSVDAEGERGQMSLYDWQVTLREDESYGWQHTKQAEDAAASMTLGLLRTFGEVA